MSQVSEKVLEAVTVTNKASKSLETHYAEISALPAGERISFLADGATRKQLQDAIKRLEQVLAKLKKV